MTLTDAGAAPSSWEDFTDRLTGVLAELESDEYLILQSTVNERFVQVAFQDFVIRVESVGEQFLAASAVLTTDQLSVLEDLGFDPATHTAGQDDDASEGSPNHWMELPTTTPLGSVAGLMVNTLRQAHLVDSPRDLEYACEHLGDGAVPQPALGIGRIKDI